MKGKKRKAQRKAVQTNENTKIRIQEVDEENGYACRLRLIIGH